MEGITIIGTGAMALYFGGRLSAAGAKVQLLGTWQEGIEAVRREGIRHQIGQEIFSYPARAVLEQDQLEPLGLVLVLVKSWQTERAAATLSRLLSEGGAALTLQNGLGNAEVLRGAVGDHRAAQGVTTYGATLLGPGIVRPAGEGVITLQEHLRMDPLVQILIDSGLNVQVVSDLSSLVWGKLVINVAINPLTALLEVRNGELLEDPAAVELLGRAAAEAADLARQLGIQLDFQDPGRAAGAVAEATAENQSSMLQDIRRGAPTEIDALCGEVVRRGQALDLPTPVNRTLDLLIKAKTALGGKT